MNNRKWLAVLIIIAMMVAFFPAMGFAENNINNGCEDCVILYAGQNIPVGTVCVSNDGEYLYVKYCIDDEYWEDGDGWGLYETHVHVGEELDDFPLNNGGNPQIGHFAYKAIHDGVQCYTEMILLDDLDADDELLIAAHAVVKKVDCETDEYTPELTWKRSSEENVANFSGYGANWDLASGFDIPLDSSEVVWDGGTGDQNDSRAGVNPEISYATWIYESNNGGNHNGYADLRRFQATFDIPEGYTITGGKLASVNNGSEDIIPINDNIYIFMNESLQFWGGTIINQQGATSFEGMNGALALRGGVAGNRDPAETDGWYIPGTFPVIDDDDFLVGENVLDVFAEEFSLWGAMHELALTLEYKECVWEDETAWGAGTRFVEKGNWATYFVYTVEEHLMNIAAWTYTGSGTTSLVQSGSNGILFDYDLPDAGYSGHWWTVSSISTCDQTFNFDWEYDYWHSWFLVDATLIAYAKQPDGTEQTIELYGVNGETSWGPQFEEGSSSLTLHAGEEFGFRIYGYNWDSSNYLKGSLLIKKNP